ncbi:MAG: hypothetical protein ACJAU3_000152 [Zhongshania sp.]|jgi:hypothetical protein
MEPVCDSYFENINSLLEEGLLSVGPIWVEAIRIYGFTEDEVKEMREYDLKRVARSITDWPFTKAGKLEQEEIFKRRMRYRESGCVEDMYASGFALKFERMRVNQRNEMISCKKKLDHLVRERRLVELEKYTIKKSKDSGSYEEKEADNFINHVFLSKFSALGFRRDGQISNKSMSIYTKELHDDYLLSVSFENDIIKKYVPVQSPFGLSLGQLQVYFGVEHSSGSLGVRFAAEDLLPISNCLSGNVYRNYYNNLCELEYLVSAHAAMYKIIRSKFEACMSAGVRKARKV